MALAELVKVPSWIGTTLYSATGAVKRSLLSRLSDRISVRDFGATGDGVTDDTAAVQSALNWVASVSGRSLYFPDGTYKVSALVCTFAANTTQQRIYGPGKLRHSSASGDMLTIQDGMYCEIELNIIGDGYTLPLPDYTQADPTGCKQAVVLNSSRACSLKINAHGYPGRVLRTKSTRTIKLSFLRLSIVTGNDTCAQGMYLEGGADAWGCIEYGNCNWDYYGSIAKNLTDFSVVYMESGSKGGGNPCVHLDNVQNAHIGTLALGQNRTAPALRITGGRAITIQKALLGESTYGLEVIGSGTGQPYPQVTIHSLYAANVDSGGVRFSNAVNCEVKDFAFDGAPYGFVYFNLCRDISVNGHSRNPSIATHYAYPGSTLQNLHIRGKHYTAGSSTFCDFSAASSTENVWLWDTTAITTGYYVKVANDSSGVNAFGGNWSGSTLAGSPPITHRLQSIKGIAGISTRRTARVGTFSAGSASGTKLTVAHGLLNTPSEVFITVQDPADAVSAGSSGVLLYSKDSTNLVFKYSGATTLANDLSFIWTAKSEDRAN